MATHLTQKEFKSLVKSGRLFRYGTIGCPDKKTYNAIKKRASDILEKKKFYDDRIAQWGNIVHLKNTEINAYDLEREDKLDKPIFNKLTMVLVWFKDSKVLGIYYYLNYEMQ